MKRIFFSVLVALAGFAATAQDINKAKLDSVFTSLEKNNKFMGSIALMRNGQIVYTNAIGYSDVEAKKRPDENTKYRIGSITKTFTATLVMKAIEEGKLKLDDTIDKYFPAIIHANKITIRQLLSHRSGIHNFTNDTSYQAWFTMPKTRHELVAIITAAGSDFEPGTRASYSNSAFVLLSFLLEDIYKKPYAELVEQRIIKPLGLKNTRVGGKIAAESNEAKSYTSEENWKLEKETDMSIPLGAGAIVSTPTDLVKFADALFNNKLVSAASLQEMQKVTDNFGFGLIRFPFYDNTSYGHTGGIDGFTSVFSYDPDHKIGYALISNGSNYNNNEISIAALSAVYNKPYQVPQFVTYKVSAEDLDKYLGTYTSTQLPLKIQITRVGAKLFAVIEGQGTRPLAAVDKDKFEDSAVGAVVVFNAATGTFVLTQRGTSFTFTKNP